MLYFCFKSELLISLDFTKIRCLGEAYIIKPCKCTQLLFKKKKKSQYQYLYVNICEWMSPWVFSTLFPSVLSFLSEHTWRPTSSQWHCVCLSLQEATLPPYTSGNLDFIASFHPYLKRKAFSPMSSWRRWLLSLQ